MSSEKNSEYSEWPKKNSELSELTSEKNSEFRIKVGNYHPYSENGHSEYSEFFSELIRTIPNFFLEFRIICGKNMEIHQNPLVFLTKIFFFLFGKVQTLFSELIFGISCGILRMTEKKFGIIQMTENFFGIMRIDLGKKFGIPN
jgi:hypothetical protein